MDAGEAEAEAVVAAAPGVAVGVGLVAAGEEEGGARRGVSSPTCEGLPTRCVRQTGEAVCWWLGRGENGGDGRVRRRCLRA